MKIIYKTETEVLRELNSEDLNESMIEELTTTFDNREILKYEVTYQKGTSISQIHDLNNAIDEGLVKSVTIVIK